MHDTNTDILAIATGRFKAPAHINHSLSHVGLSVRSLIGILAKGWFDDISTDVALLGKAARASARCQCNPCHEMTQNSPSRTGCNDYTCALEIPMGPLSSFG